MLAVHPAPIGHHELSLDSEEVQAPQESALENLKQQQAKKPRVTCLRLLVGLALLCIVAMMSYKVLAPNFPARTESNLIESQKNFIQTPESSSGKDTSSNGDSQSTRSAKNSDRPIGVANTIKKDNFSSNIKGGMQGGSGGGEDPNQEDNDGRKRKQRMDKNTKDGTSTQEDSEQASEDDSGSTGTKSSAWPKNVKDNKTPLVGSTRN